MELDDFRGKGQVTGMGRTGGSDQVLESVMKEVEANSKRQRKKTVLFAAILVIMASLYAAISNRGDSHYSTGMLLIAAGMVSGALYLYIKARGLKNSLYSLPVNEFLEAAEKRLTYFRVADWLVIIPILLVFGAGGGMVLISRLLNYTDNKLLLIVIWVIFYTGLVIFGYFAGRKDWSKEHGALLKQVHKIREELS